MGDNWDMSDTGERGTHGQRRRYGLKTKTSVPNGRQARRKRRRVRGTETGKNNDSISHKDTEATKFFLYVICSSMQDNFIAPNQHRPYFIITSTISI